MRIEIKESRREERKHYERLGLKTVII